MAYTFTRFGDMDFPDFERGFELDTAPILSRNISAITGGVDGYGFDRAVAQFPYPIMAEGAIHADKIGDMLGHAEKLRGQSARKQKLYRKSEATGEIHWCYARLRQVRQQRRPTEWWQYKLRFEFDIWSHWHGISREEWFLNDGNFINDGYYLNEGQPNPWSLNDGLYLNDGLFLNGENHTATLESSPTAMTIVNTGNITVTDVVVTLTVGSAAMSGLDIQGTGAHWTYTGGLNAGDILRVDTATYKATVNDVLAYGVGKFQLGANHASEGWLELEQGINDLSITYTGGGGDSTIAVQFTDWWA